MQNKENITIKQQTGRKTQNKKMDERIRNLERLAATGDSEAQERLERANSRCENSLSVVISSREIRGFMKGRFNLRGLFKGKNRDVLILDEIYPDQKNLDYLQEKVDKIDELLVYIQTKGFENAYYKAERILDFKKINLNYFVCDCKWSTRDIAENNKHHPTKLVECGGGTTLGKLINERLSE